MRVLTMILAGGKGRRLFPLTRHRTKPAVPFGGIYRLVDFTLSNLVNSGLTAIYALVQYRSQSLIEHLRIGWPGRGITTDQFITVVPPQMRHGESWYRGSGDAIRQNLNLVQTFQPDVLAVFMGDLVFRMDVRQVLSFHRRHEAEVTLACAPAPLNEAHRLGVVQTDREGKILEFIEKPENPRPMPDRPDHAMASMGCCLFEASSLVEMFHSQIDETRRPIDLSRDVLPRFVERGRAYAYPSEQNEIPGLKSYETQGYWRDIGTLGSYWAAHMDLLGAEPPFNLFNEKWAIYPARSNMPPTRFRNARLEDSLVGEGGQIDRATVRRSVIGRGVTIERGAVIEESIIMENTRIGAQSRIRRAIIDRHNEIAPNTLLAPDAPPHSDHCFFDKAADLVAVARGGIAAPPEDLPLVTDESDGLTEM